jgi:hypothetical protein
MTNKQITGIFLFGISIGALVYLYGGFLKPRLEVYKEVKEGKTSPNQTTTTK